MLAESARYDPSTQRLEVTGFLKGNCINANQLVHITGIDDFEVDCIEILNSKSRLERFRERKKPQKNEPAIVDETPLLQHCTINDEIYPFHKDNAEHDPN